jgi:hypothetical protein
MKGHLEGTGAIYQVSRSFDIDLPVFPQDSKHDTVDVETFSRIHVLIHGFEIVEVVAEISRART